MKLSQTKINDRVFIFVDANFNVVSYQVSGGSKLSCIVLQINASFVSSSCSGWAYLLGFDATSGLRPNGCSNMSATKYAKQASWALWVYDADCEPYAGSAMATKPAKKQEKACPLPGCGKMNDVDVAVKRCWKCGHRLPWA